MYNIKLENYVSEPRTIAAWNKLGFNFAKETKYHLSLDGFRYFQAIREELTERDNLPDYRMPQNIGLSNFNRSR